MVTVICFILQNGVSKPCRHGVWRLILTSMKKIMVWLCTWLSSKSLQLISEKFDEHSIEDTIQDLKETFDEQIQLLQNNLNQETLSLKNKFPNESYEGSPQKTEFKVR